MDLLLDMKSILLQAELRIQVLPHSYQFPINNTAATPLGQLPLSLSHLQCPP